MNNTPPDNDPREHDHTLVYKIAHSPWGQSAFVLVIELAGMCVSRFILMDAELVWQIGATGLLFFAGANPVMGLFQRKWSRYVLFSFINFAVILALTLLMGHMFSSSSLGDLVHFQLFFLAVSVFFIVINGLMGFYRFILRLLHDAK